MSANTHALLARLLCAVEVYRMALVAQALGTATTPHDVSRARRALFELESEIAQVFRS